VIVTPAPLGKLQREAALLALGLASPGLALEGALDRRAEIRFEHAGVLAGPERRGAQLEQLRAEGCAKIYREKASGAQADRRELLHMLKGLGRHQHQHRVLK
jgi:hypothetical protein